MPWLSWIVSNIVLALLLAVAAWLTQRWLRRPALAHVLWVLVLVKLITPPLVSVPLRDSPGNLSCTLGTCNCAAHQRTQATELDRLPWVLCGAWLIGASITGWCAWRRWARFERLLTHARPAPPDWQALAVRLAAELDVRPPEILVIPGRLPPLVVPGRHQPRLLLPMGLLDSLNGSQRVAMLLHELTHIQRRDHLVRVLEVLVSVAYWWLPFVGSIGRQLRVCEEACCDAAVVARRPEARREYAKLLLDVVDFSMPISRQAVPQATAMGATASGLEQRLLKILDASSSKRRKWPVAALAVALACVTLPFQLRYDWVRQPPAVPSVESEPAAATPSMGEECDPKAIKLVCCPA
jgi:bla regulator protein blaR1